LLTLAAEAGLSVAIEFKNTTYGADIISLKIIEPEAMAERSPGEEG